MFQLSKRRILSCMHNDRGMGSLMIVLILVLVAALAVYAAANIFSAVSTFKLNSAAVKMITDIELAEHLARTHSAWYGVIFLADPTNQYSVYQTDGVTDTTVTDPVNAAQPLVINLFSTFKGVTISTVSIGNGNKVEFNPLGVPYDDKNGAALSASGVIILSYGGSQKVIEIKKGTGRVGIQ